MKSSLACAFRNLAIKVYVVIQNAMRSPLQDDKFQENVQPNCKAKWHDLWVKRVLLYVIPMNVLDFRRLNSINSLNKIVTWL